jgi:predicted Zn-dependent peptidase
MNVRFLEHYLPNGLHVFCEEMPGVRSAALAFLVRTGSRHEHPHEHGISHFLEHMCFKGTARRDWRAINVGFDELGSIYNAFTGKEHTAYYGWVPGRNMAAQLELLADMMRPTLPPDDFATERNVILEEIAMSGDSFDHSVADFLYKQCFGDYPLAHEILGEKETIESVERDVMATYHAERYAPGNMHLIASGAADAQAVLAAAGRYCGDWGGVPTNARDFGPVPPLPTGTRSLTLPQFKQQSVLIIYPALPPGTEHDDAIDAFTAIFGGSNSRCYWNIVQKGIATQAGVAWLAHEGCGLLAFYADGEPERAAEMLAALRREINTVIRAGVTSEEVERVTNRRRTQLALEAENPRTRIMQIIDDLEAYGHVRNATTRLGAVSSVTPRSIARYFERCPLDGDGLLVTVGPQDWPG